MVSLSRHWSIEDNEIVNRKAYKRVSDNQEYNSDDQ